MPTPKTEVCITHILAPTDSWTLLQERLNLLPVIYQQITELTAKLEALGYTAAAPKPIADLSDLSELELTK